LEFHSRSNIEKLAELSLTIEEELKQKAFVESIGDVYSAQEAFHSKISALIEAYQAECDRLNRAPGWILFFCRARRCRPMGSQRLPLQKRSPTEADQSAPGPHGDAVGLVP